MENIYDWTKLDDSLNNFSIVLDEKQKSQFLCYYQLLLEWNSFMNLTAITDFNEVVSKHFVDSLSLIKVYNISKNVDIIDIGTGAGFPGIPLKIVFPEIKITLLDSLNKRVHFLEEVINRLGLHDIIAVHGRAEELAARKEYRELYDVCVLRAVANLSTLSELCLPFVKVGGKFISYKSEKLSEEIKLAEGAIDILGGKVSGQEQFMLPYTDIQRNLLVIDKIKTTPKKYPRRPGTPAKEPLYRKKTGSAE